jgi:hypothetical protein
MLASHAAEVGVVANQVREFCALLDEVAPGEAFDLVPEARDPEKLREHVA